MLHYFLCAAQVRLADGHMQQCLVPVACLMNHSPWPHIVRYGHVNPESGRLDFPPPQVLLSSMCLFLVCRDREQAAAGRLGAESCSEDLPMVCCLGPLAGHAELGAMMK